MDMMEQSRWAPGLSNDFQLVIDVRTGSIIHIDLDRLFQKEITPVQWDECCIEELENITDYIVARKYVSTTIYDDESTTHYSAWGEQLLQQRCDSRTDQDLQRNGATVQQQI
eukprot:CAMPEP_0170905162 /NCGR_PEP_ID=MMETSP0734-20130129/50862_1 /TAXON_ID=186038 /ORGANISM="Fragilariopsis kerguelensis, Strain L26-C5" /LENGTH=111 /DNA_ID=CAMNT_0011300815 /DNA_START=305 /DNA_END=640 /DNA_ORIENTATION=+